MPLSGLSWTCLSRTVVLMLNAEKWGKKKRKKKWKSSLGATNSVSTLNIITKNFVDALTTFNNPRRSCLITMLWPGLRRIYLSIYFWWTRQMSIQWNKRVWLLLLIFFVWFHSNMMYHLKLQDNHKIQLYIIAPLHEYNKGLIPIKIKIKCLSVDGYLMSCHG